MRWNQIHVFRPFIYYLTNYLKKSKILLWYNILFWKKKSMQLPKNIRNKSLFETCINYNIGLTWLLEYPIRSVSTWFENRTSNIPVPSHILAFKHQPVNEFDCNLDRRVTTQPFTDIAFISVERFLIWHKYLGNEVCWRLSLLWLSNDKGLFAVKFLLSSCEVLVKAASCEAWRKGEESDNESRWWELGLFLMLVLVHGKGLLAQRCNSSFNGLKFWLKDSLIMSCFESLRNFGCTGLLGLSVKSAIKYENKQKIKKIMSICKPYSRYIFLKTRWNLNTNEKVEFLTNNSFITKLIVFSLSTCMGNGQWFGWSRWLKYKIQSPRNV